MDIYVKVKTLGSRREILAPVRCVLPDHIASLRQLLTALVQHEVERYNRKEPGTRLIPFLTQQELEDQARTGKVGFGRIHSDKKADPEKAIVHALQCYEDGLVRILMNDEELTGLDEPLVIPQGTVLTLIRLTFLAGRMW